MTSERKLVRTGERGVRSALLYTRPARQGKKIVLISQRGTKPSPIVLRQSRRLKPWLVFTD